jgi:hypothetical protein
MTNQLGELEFDLEVTVNQNRRGYRPASLAHRSAKKPFWRRHLVWLSTALILIVIFVNVLVGITTHRTKPPSVQTVTNSILHSVASSGLFLNDGVT